MMVEARGVPRAGPMEETPRLMQEIQGVASVIAHGDLNDAERTFRLDRIRECCAGIVGEGVGMYLSMTAEIVKGPCPIVG